jgi:hypothetical protein
VLLLTEDTAEQQLVIVFPAWASALECIAGEQQEFSFFA